MNIALHRSCSGANESQQSNRHVNVHKKLAPTLVGAHRQKPEYRQCHSEPCWNQRRRVLAPRPEESRQTKGNQKTSKHQCYFCHARPLSGYTASIPVAWMNQAAARCTIWLAIVWATAECAPIRPWRTPSPGPGSPSSCRRRKWSAARHAPTPASRLLPAFHRSAVRK
jgi:hypothetical protein